jgi:hypothetical protein
MQLICVQKQTPWDATDTREADTFGRNWYNFLTAGCNSYFPLKAWLHHRIGSDLRGTHNNQALKTAAMDQRKGRR